MMRYVLCPKCTEKMQLHPEDKEMGFKQRRVTITARRPEGLAVTMTTPGHTTVTPVPRLVCDLCSGEILDGTPGCMCVTHYRGEQPAKWEEDYQMNPMNTWQTFTKHKDGAPCTPYQTLRGRHWTIYLIRRQGYCLRGNWYAQLHPNLDDPPRHDVEGSHVNEQDPWPRYYFDEDRAKLELEAWLTKRNQRV